MEESSPLSLRNKTPAERREMLARAGFLDDRDRELYECRLTDWAAKLDAGGENVFGVLPKPLSAVADFMVNGVRRIVTMVTEESSVVAAASKAAKLALPQGFSVKVTPRRNVGHFCLIRPDGGALDARRKILDGKAGLMAAIREKYDPMAQYGGGLRSLLVHVLKEEDGGRLEVSLAVDTVDAQGSKIVTRMAETAAKFVVELAGGEAVGAICDNASPGIGVIARATWKDGVMNERHLARFLYVYEWAALSPHRAATHNKGIMNGILAVCDATGQDTRAVYEAIADESRRDGRCRPLSRFVRGSNGDLVGRLFVPLHVATVGGGTMTEMPRRNFRMMGIDTRETGSSRMLAQIIGAVGLAQNFAALMALSSPEGFSAATYGSTK